jgi:hypothetical protein
MPASSPAPGSETNLFLLRLIFFLKYQKSSIKRMTEWVFTMNSQRTTAALLLTGLLSAWSTAAVSQLILLDLDQVFPGSDFVNDGSASYKYNPPFAVAFDDYNTANVTYTESEDIVFGISGNEQLRVQNNKNSTGGIDGVLRYNLSHSSVSNFLNHTGSGEDKLLLDLETFNILRFEFVYLGNAQWADVQIDFNTDADGGGGTLFSFSNDVGPLTPNVRHTVSLDLFNNPVFRQSLTNVAADSATTYAQLRIVIQTPAGDDGTLVFDSFTLNEAEKYDSWVSAYQLSEPDADPRYDYDGDGLDNVSEYAFGGNPTNRANTGYSPTCEMIFSNGAEALQYTYPRRTSPGNDLSYHLDIGASLTARIWRATGYTELPNPAPLDENFEAVINLIPLESPQAFVKLQVAVPQMLPFQAEHDFEDTFDAADWQTTQTSWQVITWVQNGTQMSSDRCDTDGLGHLVQTVLAGEPYSGGSIESRDEFGFGRWVARLKPSAVPGVLNSMFIKDWDDHTTLDIGSDGTKAEIDIEFLTHTFGSGTGTVNLAVHFDGRHNYVSTQVPLDFNPSDEFHEWGFDILPDRVVWHVDGRTLFTWLYSDDAAMNENYEFYFNAWTQDIWILGPPATNAEYQIDWVRFYPITP